MSLGYVTVNIQKMSYKKMELLTGLLVLLNRKNYKCLHFFVDQ